LTIGSGGKSGSSSDDGFLGAQNAETIARASFHKIYLHWSRKSTSYQLESYPWVAWNPVLWLHARLKARLEQRERLWPAQLANCPHSP
jgi:hypothetical protein